MPSKTGSVHQATTSRLHKGRLYQTHLLRRTFRVGTQVKHETWGNISYLPSDLVQLIRRALAGEKFLPATQALVVQRDLPHGHVQAVLGAGHDPALTHLDPGRRIERPRCH